MRLVSQLINNPRFWAWSGRLVVLALAIAALSGGGQAHAAAYDPGRIIDDSRFVKQTMDATAIQNWLNAVNSTCLKNATAPVPLGGGNYGGDVSVATIIAETARIHGINPQVLLVTLQKEQGLVTRTDCPSWRYDAAMGAGCPDTAACNEQYKGLSKQIYEGGRYLRNCFYQDKPTWWCSYIPYTTGTVKFHPNDACGSTQVYISNRATATLYNYTPYQPNAAVLGGHADACSAFGNLNFLYYMDYWFPDPTTTGFSLIKGNSSPNQYLLQNFNGTLSIRLIPDPSIILAWGLDKVALQTVDDSVVSTTTRVSPDLTRLSRPSGALTVFFMDNGKRHAIGSVEMMGVWGLSPAAICDVSTSVGLIPTVSSDLTYAVRSTDSTNQGIYMMDGATLRQYQDPSTLKAWEGDSPVITTISDGFLQGLPSGTNLTHPRIIDANSNQYLAQSGKKYALDPARASLYPWSPQTVSEATLSRLTGAGLAPVYFQAPSDPAVYLIDGAKKHHVTDPDVLRAWLGGLAVVSVPSGTVELLPSGASISGYLADSQGSLFVMDGSKIPVSANLDSAYRTGKTAFTASQNLLGLLSSGSGAQGFIRATNSPDIFLLDASGQRRHINTPARWKLWDGDMGHVSQLSPSIVGGYPLAGTIGAYVSDGTSEFIIDGSKYPVTPSVKADWGLNTPIVLDSATLARFSNGANLANSARANQFYYLVRGSLAYATVDANLADMWGAAGGQAHKPELISELVAVSMLTRFVGSNQAGDTRIFTSDNGRLYHLSPTALMNLGFRPGEPQARINPSAMTGFVQDTWSAVILQDSASKHYVVDDGTKRPFSAPSVQSYWTNGGTLPVAVISNGFLNLMANGGIIERAVKGSSVNVYAVPGGQKRLITNPAVYASSYAPYSLVSDKLIADLPNGPSI